MKTSAILLPGNQRCETNCGDERSPASADQEIGHNGYADGRLDADRYSEQDAGAEALARMGEQKAEDAKKERQYAQVADAYPGVNRGEREAVG